MGVDRGIPAVDEESQLAKPAAVADELIDVGMSRGGSGALESEIRQMPFALLCHSRRQRLDAFMFFEVHGVGGSQLFGEVQALLLPVHRHDLVDAHGAQDGDADQADGAAALYHDTAVEPKYACALRPLHRVDQHRAGLDQHSGVQIQVADIEHGGALSDQDVIGEPPFGLIPVALGHEGTGEIVKMGRNVKKDSAGKDLKVGDKVVTCMIFKDNPDITMFDLNKHCALTKILSSSAFSRDFKSFSSSGEGFMFLSVSFQAGRTLTISQSTQEKSIRPSW